MPHRPVQSTAGRSAPAGRACALGALALTMVLAGPRAAQAQASGDGFLFDAPQWTLSLRGGFDRALAGSDIFQFMTDTLTLSKGDFSGFTFGGDLAYSISPRVDIAFGAGYVRSRKVSEFREYVGSDDLPITQTTTFSRLPLTTTVKAFLTPRGRSIGTLAWIPTKFAPYVGIGAGALRYEFHQEGEFVDSQDDGSGNFDIFYDDYRSSGWAPTAHALLGAEFALTPRFGVSTEGRYGWAKSDMSDDFIGFEPIDLSGFSATMGLTVRF